jgi:acetyl-CoA C-acetyltransferase
MSRPVAVIGVGQTKHGNRSEITYPDLIREAVNNVYAETGLDPKDIEGVIYGSMPSMMEGVAQNHFYFADALGARNKPFMRTETCGTTGISLAFTGYYWVASGYADLVLVVGSEKMLEGDAQATMTTVAEPFYHRPFISGAPGYYSILSQQWMHHYNIPEDKCREAAAKLSVDHHRDACLNPYAHVQREYTMDMVKDAPVVVYPIRFLDVCPASDGACAVIFASEKWVDRIAAKPAWIKGVGFRGDEYYVGDNLDRVWSECPIGAAREAYQAAGITNPLEELDVAELYNPFTFVELMHFEAFGFCEPGQASDMTLEGRFELGGKLPVCPSGGVLCSNPIGATALIRVAEAALQVSGRAGAIQVDGAKTALAAGLGGCNQFNGVMILGAEL